MLMVKKMYNIKSSTLTVKKKKANKNNGTKMEDFNSTAFQSTTD